MSQKFSQIECLVSAVGESFVNLDKKYNFIVSAINSEAFANNLNFLNEKNREDLFVINFFYPLPFCHLNMFPGDFRYFTDWFFDEAVKDFNKRNKTFNISNLTEKQRKIVGSFYNEWVKVAEECCKILNFNKKNFFFKKVNIENN